MDRRIIKFSLYLQASFYTLAGVNHFLHPEFYLPLIPDYLPSKALINILSGLLEIAAGLALISDRTRKWGAYSLMVLLIAFIPSHIFFIQSGSCVEGGLCVTPWIAWVRLLVVHPMLLFWAFWHAQATNHR